MRDEAHLRARERVADRIVDLLGAEIEADQRVAVEVDDDALRAAGRFELDALGAGQFLQDGLRLRGRLLQPVVIVAVNLDRYVGADALQHLVEAHFDRLGEFKVLTGVDAACDLFDAGDQLLLRARHAIAGRPVLLGAVEDIQVVLVRRHRVGRHLAGADAREGMRDLRIGTADRSLGPLFDRQALFQRHAHRAIDHGGDRAFVELRRELRSQRLEHEEGRSEQRHRPDDEQ